ncbi:MAG: SRPBCC domain-containing protein [Phycisphaerales bacterium]|nr:SRPBCC domain-containing protein [Phycisphaerales bacterium]
MARTTLNPQAVDKQWTLTISRTFDAPIQLVWDAWTCREHLTRWFCPKDFSVLSFESDLREGGQWRSVMRGPDGSEYIHFGTFREIMSPHRLVLTHAWEQNHQEPTAETVITVTLVENGGRTTMSFEQIGLATEASRDSHGGGWGEAFDNLAAHVKVDGDDAQRILVINRVFHAPRERGVEGVTRKPSNWSSGTDRAGSLRVSNSMSSAPAVNGVTS